MSTSYEHGHQRYRQSGVTMACASATLATIALGPGQAHALDLNWNEDHVTETIASRERRSVYGNAQIEGVETVRRRDRSFAEPEGGRLGYFLFHTGLQSSAAYNDNIFGTATEAVGDLRTELKPYLSIRSDMPRHMIEMTMDGRLVSYAENEDQNYADVQGRLAGRLDIDHAHTFAAMVSSSIRHEERGSDFAPSAAAEPIEIHYNKASAWLTRDVGRLYGTLSAAAEEWQYSDVEALDGSTLDQSARDTAIYSGQIKLGYRFSPGYDLVGRFRTYRLDNETDYGIGQTSTGYEAVAGLNFEANPLWKFRLLGGYGMRDFDDQDLDPIKSYMVEGDVYWLPTQLLTFTGTLRHAITDELGADDRGSAIETVVTGRVDYEIRHDLVGSVGAEYSKEEFVQTGRIDDTWTLKAGLDWYYTKHWVFSLGYEYDVRDSSFDEADLTRNIYKIGAKLKF